MHATPSGIKIIAAFLAGIVLALGAGLIYTRTNSIIHQQRASEQSASAVPEVPASGAAQPSNVAPAPETLPEADRGTKDIIHDPDAVFPRPRLAREINRPIERAKTLADRRTPTSPITPPSPTATSSYPEAPQFDRQVAREASSPASVPDIRQPGEPQPIPPPAPRSPMTVTFQAGTVIPVRLSEKLSTEENYSGDTFRAVLDQPLILNGFIIADKGSKVLGRVVEAKRAGRVEGVADLSLALTEINTTDGQIIRIQTNTWSRQGPTSHQRDAAEIGGGAALGAIIGALAGGGKGAAIGAGAGGATGAGVALGTRGKPAVLPVETHLSFRLQNPVTITERLS